VQGDVNEAKLAFRAGIKQRIDTDKKLEQKMNMESFIEGLRRAENEDTFNFVSDLDPHADAKNIKMLYLYREGAEAQYKGIQHEIMQNYKQFGGSHNRQSGKQDMRALSKRVRESRLKKISNKYLSLGTDDELCMFV
jgi:hypothetical protein